MEDFINKKKTITKNLSNVSKNFYKKYKDNLVNRNCFICNNKTSTILHKSHTFYNTVQCEKCLSQRIDPIFNEETLTIFYEDKDCAFSDSNNYRKEITKLLVNNFIEKKYYDEIKNDIKFNHYFKKMQKVVNYIKKYPENTFNILEVGCSYGLTLIILNKLLENVDKKVNIYGIDLNSEANFIINDKFSNITIIPSCPLNKLKEKVDIKFNLIMAFELIEHLFNFQEFIKDINELLTKKGIFYFSCPNGQSIPMSEGCDKNLSFMQHSLSPPMHINEFNPRNVTLFSYINNFNVISIETKGKLDLDLIIHSKIHESSKLNEWRDLFLSLNNTQKLTLQDIINHNSISSAMEVFIEKQ